VAATLIRVTFIDAASDACFARTEMPVEQLPESFEARTTLNLEDQDWEVVRAVPITRAEFEKSGELHLTLSKLTLVTVPASELLYSLPTICDFIPGIAAGTSKLGKLVVELHEDDWRQIELVVGSQRAAIDSGLTAVRAIHDHERTKGGAFRKLHIRKEVASPLSGCNIRVAELSSYLRSLAPLDGIAYRDVAGLIEGGFAFRSDSGLCLYGLQTSGSVTTLAIQPERLVDRIVEDASSLAALMRAHDLCLVDWCRVFKSDGSDAAITSYLTRWSTR
jgi:hypothetical protein